MTMTIAEPMTTSTEIGDRIVDLINTNHLGVVPSELLQMRREEFSHQDRSLHIENCLVQANPNQRGNIVITMHERRGDDGEALYGAVFAPDSLLTPATTHTNLRAGELLDLLVQKAGLIPAL